MKSKTTSLLRKLVALQQQEQLQSLKGLIPCGQETNNILNDRASKFNPIPSVSLQEGKLILAILHLIVVLRTQNASSIRNEQRDYLSQCDQPHTTLHDSEWPETYDLHS